MLGVVGVEDEENLFPVLKELNLGGLRWVHKKTTQWHRCPKRMMYLAAEEGTGRIALNLSRRVRDDCPVTIKPGKTSKEKMELMGIPQSKCQL